MFKNFFLPKVVPFMR